MSTTLDKQLKGSNFCWLDCSERKAIIHPETCVKQVKITDNSDSTLEDWILRTSNNDEITDSMSSYTGLLDWLQTNYPVSGGSSTVSPATATTLGVIKTGEGNEWLNLDNNGVLTFNDSNLPTATINPATTSKLGGIYMGTDSIMSNYVFNSESYINIRNIETLSDTLDGDYYAIPLRKDELGKAGVIIPKRVLSTQVKANWEETNPNSNAYIQNKPELATVATSGDYNDLNNIHIDYWDISYSPCNINFHTSTFNPNDISGDLAEQIAQRQSDTNVFKYAPPININIIDPINAVVSQELFKVINTGLEEKLYDGNPSHVYCELNIKFTVSNENTGNGFFTGSLYLTGSQSFTCINNTDAVDILRTSISYIENPEDSKDYLKVTADNRGGESIVDCNLNIILSRAGANWQANVCLTTLPHTVLTYTPNS